MSHVRQDSSGSLGGGGGSLCGVPSGASASPPGSVSQKKTWWWVPTETEKQLQLIENSLCGSTQSPHPGGANPSCNHWLAHNFFLLTMTFQCFQKSPGHYSSHMQSMYIVSVSHCMHVHSNAFSVTHASPRSSWFRAYTCHIDHHSSENGKVGIWSKWRHYPE